ncbi:sensor histidine kinase [Herbidospora mongoliensis]|uniref:sensor histidine kinase n=1 Tax=Herbidospora mongoliensis TaxID=688067 RepID=UPI00082FA7E4|nr:histidine kinase [Herbidospora mongoliensis]
MRFSRLFDVGLWLVACAPPVAAATSLHGREVITAAVSVPLLGAAVAVSRRRPLAALAVPVALSLLQDVQMLTPVYWTTLVIFAYLAGHRTTDSRPAVWFFAAVAVIGLPLSALVLRDLWGWPTQLLTLLLTVGLPWLAGRYRRQYAELVGTGWRLAARLEHEQRAVADRARIRERARIAGDMHDSLGHELTLIAVRAGALELDPALDSRQRAAIGELRQAAGTATERLRDIIGVLRTDDEEPISPDETAESLVERARDSGMIVTLERVGDPAGLPPMVGLAVHRLLQEALTNAAKHAPGAAVHTRLVRDQTTLRLTVLNAPAAAASLPGVASGGSGLLGLGERVRLAGGTLRTGPTPAGGFELVADLPTVDGASPRPSTSSMELGRARQQVRRRLLHTVVVPVAVLAGIVLLTIPISVITSSLSVLDRTSYEKLKVGDTAAQLPAFTRDGPPDDVPPPPEGQNCAYYNTKTASSEAYRLCFVDERLVSKTVVGHE